MQLRRIIKHFECLRNTLNISHGTLVENINAIILRHLLGKNNISVGKEDVSSPLLTNDVELCGAMCLGDDIVDVR